MLREFKITGLPCVANPQLAGGTKKKTGVLDARMLAHQDLTGLWPKSYVLSDDEQELRLLMAQCRIYASEAAKCINRINNYSMRFGHTVGKIGSVNKKASRDAIERMCDGETVFDPCAGKNSPERHACPDGIPEAAAQVIRSLYARCDESIRLKDLMLGKAVGKVSSMTWATANGSASGDEILGNLLTVPGIGEFTALTWLAEIITPLRFGCPKKLAAYCGLDPSLKVSAGKVTSYKKRKGNTRIHRTAACGCVRRHSEPLGQWGYSLCKKTKKGAFGKASGAVARRMAVAMYYVHTRNEPFSYSGYSLIKLGAPDMPLLEAGLSKRVTAILSANGIESTAEMEKEFYAGTLYGYKSFGSKAAEEVRLWLEKNK
jgi:transposase